MILTLALSWWIFLYLPGIVVQSLEAQLDVRLVDSLSHNESGVIRSLSWRRRNATSYQLVAASLSQTQVWNHVSNNGSNRSQEWELGRRLDFFVVQPIRRSNDTAVRAVSFSPDGKWLAIGGDAGLVQIWSVATMPWKLVRTLTTSSNGKIRSLSWHSNTLFLAAAGIDFGFLVWDVNRNWSTTVMEPRSPTLPPPPQDSYLHYVDWSPIPMGSTRNSFVVDTTIYEVTPGANVFAESNASASARAIAVLDACRLCTLPQWSHDGQTIATAFGTSISISQKRSVKEGTNVTDPAEERWDLVRNITTVNGTYMVIGAMEWSPNGNYLAVGGADQALLFLYDGSNWTAPPITFATFGDVNALAWRPDGTHIAVGTDGRIEILEILAPDMRPSPPTAFSNDALPPARAPGAGALPTPLTLDSGLSIGSMAGIGIAAIAISFTIVGIVFCQRMRLVTKRKRQKREGRDHKDNFHEGDITASEDYCDPTSPLSMDHRITVSSD